MAWAQTDSKLRTLDEPGGPYAAAWMLSLGENIQFAVWVDRTLAPGSVDRPILCAAFEATSDHDRPLRDATEGRVRVRRYGPHDRERLNGFGGAPTIELAETKMTYLSSYRPSAAFDVLAARDQFADFFRRWAPRVEAACVGDVRVPSRAAAMPAEGGLTRLEGLVGELAVLRLPGWEVATWVGPTNAVHDIETAHRFVEVKTTVGEDRAPVLSRQQISCGSDERFFFALVDMPVEALRLLAGHGTGLPAPDAFLVRRKEDIQRYLAPTRIAVDDALLRKLSAAVRMCSIIKWHHLRAPEGWAELLSAIEKHGDIVEFRQRCPIAWFTPCPPPTP